MAYTEIAMAVGNSPETLARNVKMMISSGFQPYGDVQMLSGTLFGMKMAKGTANNVEDFMVTSDTTIQGLVNRVNRYLAQGWRRFGNAHFEDGAYISALAKGDFVSDEGGGSGEAGPQGPVGPQGPIGPKGDKGDAGMSRSFLKVRTSPNTGTNHMIRLPAPLSNISIGIRLDSNIRFSIRAWIDDGTTARTIRGNIEAFNETGVYTNTTVRTSISTSTETGTVLLGDIGEFQGIRPYTLSFYETTTDTMWRATINLFTAGYIVNGNQALCIELVRLDA
ncbi:JK_26P [Escherichia phage Jk06]|uniref:JK_26P n=1 Tax=Escherichia phage Jk06 TaxID=2886922 RepID=Q45PZ0_9CAUD|nr:DNA polymerase [Escherichia phage Jk06]AAZ29276.1 JK_26P [Escherichia phage Jk06]